MKIIKNKILPPKGFKAINLFGILFAREGTIVYETTILHEEIHTAQMKEMLYIFFYLWYVVEWLIKLFIYRDSKKAYREISFEREAYKFQAYRGYLGRRKHYVWFKYITNEA